MEFRTSDKRIEAKMYTGVSTQGTSDPSPALLEALRRAGYPVLPVSRCSDASGVVRDKLTNAIGVKFMVLSVTFISPSHAEARGGFFMNGKSASETMYTAALKRGKWTVTRSRPIVVAYTACLVQHLYLG